ncbi:MAG: 16S rRNA (cytidine(1402)-2'-O)-methyltransferase [Actinobacteria bacterium]|nr:16S rRNA (cytidine(1402)-2'-O)-methyltransferase [Actinomycetota bacterium]
MEDIAPRAAHVLRDAAMILCEDTRHSGSLLKRIGVTGARLVVANDHTEHDAAGVMLGALASGAVVAVITDAGSPGVSDPGERLVRAAIEAGHPVHAVPGPAAFVMAATVSGLPTARIAFDGFLPRSGAERRNALTETARERRTTVLYEAPHRLARTLEDLRGACGGARRVALARELTKMHENVWRGTLDEACAHVASVEPRGEYAVVIEPAPVVDADVTDDAIADELRTRISAGVSRRDAVDEVTTALGVPRKRVYGISVGL